MRITRKRVKQILWLLGLSPIIIAVLALTYVGLTEDIPSFEELEDPQSNLATQIISEEGEVLNTFHVENRAYITYDELSIGLKDAIIATEDVRFFNHSGIDFKSLARVGVKTVILRDRRGGGGGSTLTQQLAKSLFPRETSDSEFAGARYLKLVNNKLKEWITAVKLERNYTKKEILSMYMNSVFFGSNAYGIRAASLTFFDKLPIDLTIEESALLVGMVNMPTRYNPVRNPDLSLNRRNHVLSQMKKYEYITETQYDSIVKIPIKLAYKTQDHNSGIAHHFRDMLRRTMNKKKPERKNYDNVEDYNADLFSWDTDPFYGWLNKNFKPDGSKYNLDKDGLKIYTPVNYKMQQYAEEAVVEHLSKSLQPQLNKELVYKANYPFFDDTSEEVIESIMKQARRWSDRYRVMSQAGAKADDIVRSFDKPAEMRVFSWNKNGYIDTVMTPNDSIRYYKSFLRAGLMSIEPNTGFVKAYVGSSNYRYFKYDQVSQGKRQVGSTFKPFLYTVAMQGGYTPCDKVVNVPQSFVVQDGVWTPKSTDRAEWIGKTVTLKWGITKSSNNISAYLMKQFGPKALVDMAHSMGVKTWLPSVYSLCVGSADVPVYQMVSAFNTFPGRGVYAEPVYVLKIEDKEGNVLSDFSPRKREAISQESAYLMVNLMEGAVNDGTALRVRRLYIPEGDAAGKTGTTNDQSDGWFIGYTPRLTTGVWVGAEDRQVHFSGLALGSGSNMALPIWGIFMKKVLDDGTLGVTKEDQFIKPHGFEVNLDCTGTDSDMEKEEQKVEEIDYFGSF